MTRNARAESRGPGREIMRFRIDRPCAAVIMALALSACSVFQPSEQVARQPSLRVADAALASGAPELALRIADIILAKEPRDRDALIARGDGLYTLGQNNKAEAAYRASLAVDPTSARARVGLGRTLARTDPHGAEQQFLMALTDDPDNVVALNNLGVVRDLQGRNGEAQEAYRRALAVSPESGDVRINLGMSFALSGHRMEAQALLRGVAENPEAAQIWRKELLAGLTLAGDGAWAQRMLQPDSPQTSEIPVVESESRRLASAAALAAVSIENGSAPNEPASAPRMSNIEREAIPPSSGGTNEIPDSLVATLPQPLHLPTSGSTSGTAADVTDQPSRGPAKAVPFVAITSVISINSKPAGGLPTRPNSSAASTGLNSPGLGAHVFDQKAEFATAQPVAPSGVGTPTLDDVRQRVFVQLGSLLSESDAMFEWRRLNRRLSEALADRNPTVTKVEVSGRSWWRLRAFGFANVTEAKELCGYLREEGWSCFSGKGL
jgi:Tfp pilus assembly protein PilF